MANLPQFEAISLTIQEKNIAVITLNRPQKLNAFNFQMFKDLEAAFKFINDLEVDIRVVILAGSGKHFTAGLDLQTAGEMFTGMPAGIDPARVSQRIYQKIKLLQRQTFIQCRVPVIAAIQGYCIGAGIDLTSSCDIRVCTKDAKFSIKEIDIGISADLGTFQLISKITGNDSWARELGYTGRFFDAQEALNRGFVSQVYQDQADMMVKTMSMALEIASKTPVAIATIKKCLDYSRDHSIKDGLDYIAILNSASFQTEDMQKAVVSNISKQKPLFSKL